MRLEKVKLAGFKSFVDPTTIPLPGNLVGVVGPNGCGKSNVIDAVRWVMGESSAKHLRGDTMADVIFNGSSSRKPVGVASVELIFDNTSGRASGEYAAYEKISIKRQVGRDGQSTYHLNGARCRRKDITDLFLGTGLGARSYAIIEQGTISRLIEAKPEELREIIEEAAGISRYKERRHETEIRMRHTRENLDRLDDVRSELRKQVENLQRQVKKTERYLALRERERDAKGTLLRLRWTKVLEAQRHRHAALEQYGEELRRCASADREVQESLAQCHSERERRQSALQELQGEFYELGAEMGRLDDHIKQVNRSREEARRDLDRVTAERCRAEDELSQDRQQLEQIRSELLAAERSLEQVESRHGEAARARRTADDALRALQAELDATRSLSVRVHGERELLRARERQNREQQRQIQMRRERLNSELEELRESLQDGEIRDLEQAVAEAEGQNQASRQQRIELTAAIESDQQRLQQLRQQLHQVRAELHTLQGRLTSLELLQQHAMGKDKAELAHWLNGRDLDQAPRLVESLTVVPGWEAAVESVLGLHLGALCVDDATPYLEDLASATFQESLAMLERRPPRSPAGASVGRPRLLDYVECPWDLSSVLGGVACASSLSEARRVCEGLSELESVVTTKGERVGPGWVALQRPDDGKAGVVERERDIRQVRLDLSELARTDAELAGESSQAETRVRAAEAERREVEECIRTRDREILDLRNELHAFLARYRQAERRLSQVHGDLDELESENQTLAESVVETAEALRKSDDDIGSIDVRVETLRGELDTLQQQSAETEQSFESASEDLQLARSRCETLRSSEQLTANHLQRAQAHYEEAIARLEHLSARFEEGAPVAEDLERLESMRDQRQRTEQRLTQERHRLAELDARIKAANDSRHSIEREMADWREKAEQARIELEGDQVRLEGLHEQFEELGITPESQGSATLLDAGERQLQEEIHRVAEELARLGAVNLMAVEEHTEQKARLDELEEQHRDLTESLETLMQAIEKIDRECRALFRDTYERINSGFTAMFPKLFGGGNAYLELTERDLLDAGVNVIARPPGKRNSSIHLLSGGEKALTAVALVFAIFELNPAPFCLLDEVDAPLDDANVGRFCALVKEMSQRVQFLFITHNKVTMEIAQYLAGVTMKEPGVSRIVAVDVAEAVELVAG
jgi:chromosome segregation protein